MAKSSLERYTHYYERWAAHGSSHVKAGGFLTARTRPTLNLLLLLLNVSV